MLHWLQHSPKLYLPCYCFLPLTYLSAFRLTLPLTVATAEHPSQSYASSRTTYEALWGKIVFVRWLYSALKLSQQNWWKLKNFSTLLHLLKYARRNCSNDSSEWFRSSKWTERWWLLAYVTCSKLVWYYQSVNQSNRFYTAPYRTS